MAIIIDDSDSLFRPRLIINCVVLLFLAPDCILWAAPHNPAGPRARPVRRWRACSNVSLGSSLLVAA